MFYTSKNSVTRAPLSSVLAVEEFGLIDFNYKLNTIQIHSTNFSRIVHNFLLTYSMAEVGSVNNDVIIAGGMQTIFIS